MHEASVLILLVMYYMATHTQTHSKTRLYINSHGPLPPPALLCQGKAKHGRCPTTPEGEETGGAGPEERQIKGKINVLGVCE